SMLKNGRNTDLTPYANSQSSVVFRVRVDKAPAAEVSLGMHCNWPCQGTVPMTERLRALADGAWHEEKVPLKCLIDKGLDITRVNMPFMIYTESTMTLSLENIRWEPWTAGTSPDCGVYK